MEVRSLRAVAFSMLLLVSAMAGGVAFESQTADATPPGFVSIPDSQISSDLPDRTPMGEAAHNIADAGVMSSKHADSLEVLVTNPGRAEEITDGAVFGSGPIAMVVTDDEHHEGRTIALPAKEVRQALGRTPEMARGTHEDGSKWTAEVKYKDGWLLVDVPHFSTNTITWSGQFTIESNPATDGFSHTYTQDSDPANYSIDLTGVESTETDTVSAGSVTNGGTVSADIAGNADPPSTTLTMEGNQYTGSQYTPSGTGTVTDVGINGDAEPSGPNSSEPEITFTGNSDTSSGGDSWTGVSNGETLSTSIGGNVDPTNEEITLTGSSSYGGEKTSSYSSDYDDPEGAAYLESSGVAAIAAPDHSQSAVGTIKGIHGSSFDSSDIGEMNDVAAHQDRGTFFTSTSGNMYEIDTSGDTVNSWDIGSNGGGGVDVYEEKGMFYTTGSGFVGVDISTGDVEFTSDWNGEFDPTVHKSLGYVYGGDYDANVHVVDAVTGNESVHSDLNVPASTNVRAIGVDESEDMVYVGDGSGSLHKVDVYDSGSDTLWSESIHSDEIQGLTVDESNGMVYTASADNTVKATEMDSGNVKWTYTGHSNTVSGVAQGGGNVYTASPGGHNAHTITGDSVSRDPSVDTGGGVVSFDGNLESGETHTGSVSLSPGSDSWDASGTGASFDVDASWTEVTATEDPAVDVTGDGSADASYSGILKGGETATKQLADLPVGTIDVDTTVLSGLNPDWTITYDEELHTDSPAVDIDGDGTDEAAHTGKLGPGETAETSISPTLSDDTWDVSTTGPVDVSADITERTITEDVTVSVNGNTTSYSGTLSPGSTTSLTTDTAWINESGENTVEVEVAPTLSPDAPAPGVDLYYTHDGIDDSMVSYVGEKFSERYNVSKTFANDRDSPTLSIPFAETAVSIRDAEYRVNGGDWNIAGWTFNNNTGEIDLPQVSAGDKVTVRATGTKVNTKHGDIQVLEPSSMDERLDTKVEVTDTTSDDLSLGVGDTPDGPRIHYAYDASHDDADYNDIQAGGEHDVTLPNAGTGDTFRLSTIPVTATPDTNEVEISVPDPKSTEPDIQVAPGSSSGDRVAFTYLNAQDDTDYILYSQTRDVVVDSGTANSPITLFGDDSAEILQFLIDDTGTSTSSGDDTGTAILAPVSSDDGPSIPTDLLLFAGIALAVIVGFLYRRGGTKAVASATKKSASTSQTLIEYLARLVRGTVKYFVRHPYVGWTVLAILGIFALASGFITIPTEILTYVVIAGVPLTAYYVLVRRLGASTLTWGMLSLGMILVGLQLLGTDVLAALTDWDGSVILVVGALFLANRAIKAARAPDEVNKISIGGDDD